MGIGPVFQGELMWEMGLTHETCGFTWNRGGLIDLLDHFATLSHPVLFFREFGYLSLTGSQFLDLPIGLIA